jgi:RNA polymerase sigma-70 factor (ECF subfamily)
LDSETDDSPTTTADLLEQSVAGDAEALGVLVERHLPALRVFVRLRTGPLLRERESCSDIVQSVCRELLGDLEHFEYRGEGSFRAWLFTVALNKVREKGRFHRAQKRDVARGLSAGSGQESRMTGEDALYTSLCCVEASPSEHAIGHEQNARIERAMDKLPEDYRQVLLLARIVGLPHREIAERLGRTERAVRSLVSRASVRLLAALEGRI